MIKNRVWIIPTAIIIVLIVAWSFRWGDGGKQGNKTYYIDRWLGQTWVKEVSKNGYAEYPVITDNFDMETQQAINADPILSDQMQKLEDNIKAQEEIVVRNHIYVSQYENAAGKYGGEWSIKYGNSAWAVGKTFSERLQYIKSNIPADIIDGYNTWAMANAESVRLNKERDDLWNSVQAPIKQQHMDNTITNRTIASMGSVIIGISALVWLISIFLIDKKKPWDQKRKSDWGSLNENKNE